MPLHRQTLTRIGHALLLLSVTACANAKRLEPYPAGSPAGSGADGGAAGSSGTAAASGGAGTSAVDGGALVIDAAAEDGGAAQQCHGTIVASTGGCLQDDAFCYELADGRYCTGPAAPRCPVNSESIAKDAACPVRARCWDYSEGLRCVTHLFTPMECEAAGGVALADPGDGSLMCPNAATALGSIDADWDEGGLCCPAARKPCGARAGDTCKPDEYCAYQIGQLCGQADAQATCKQRPSSCATVDEPVCGCDGETHSNACEAHAAGSGIFATGECN